MDRTFGVYLLFFLFIMCGVWLLCWGVWGGNINTRSVNPMEAGLGLDPPPLEKSTPVVEVDSVVASEN